MTDGKLKLHVDGTLVLAEDGQTILKACDEAGVYIPRLCFHPDLPPGGHCRVCTVKVNGKPMSACTTPAADGMVIENDTEELNAERRHIIEMLFVEGNHFCPFCEKSGNCELQALAYRLGMDGPRYPYLWPDRPLDASHPDIFIDRNRCILCGRCIRASKLADGKSVFGFRGRGISTDVAIDADALARTDMATTDKAADVCPVGSILRKRTAYQTPVGRRKFDHQPIGSDVETRK